MLTAYKILNNAGNILYFLNEWRVPPSRLTLAARGSKTVETLGDFYRDHFWTTRREGRCF